MRSEALSETRFGARLASPPLSRSILASASGHARRSAHRELGWSLFLIAAGVVAFGCNFVGAFR